MRVRRAVRWPSCARRVSRRRWCVAGPAAAGFTERITRYDIDLTIEPDGTSGARDDRLRLRLVPHHGIYPRRPRARRLVAARRLRPRVPDRRGLGDRVGGDAGPVQRRGRATTSASRSAIPTGTITGEHTYEITYRVRGAMNGFADHDELVWNVIGNDWSVPIEPATAVVHTPAASRRSLCSTGSFGSFAAVRLGVVDRRRRRRSPPERSSSRTRA